MTERLERLWAPHRLAYVTGDDDQVPQDGCPFCRIPTLDDAAGLVVARGEHVYAVLNKHPYNPGHLMVLPYRHVPDLEDLTPEETRGLADQTRAAVVGRRHPAAVGSALERAATQAATCSTASATGTPLRCDPSR